MATTSTRPFRFGIQLQPQRTTWQAFAEAVRAVEEFGFDTVWNFDHMLPFAGPDDAPCFETLTTLAAMAALTSRIRLGSLVNGVLYRDPATLAKSAAMIDQISNGRLEFSLGAAWAEREFAAYGIPFPSVEERLARLDEALTIVKALWTQERTTFTGAYYQVVDAPCAPKPVQQPHPPIMVGGKDRRTLRIAARHATLWNGIGSPDQCATLIGRLREACAVIGRDLGEIELSTHPNLAIAPTHAAAVEKARAAARALGHELQESEYDRWLLGTPEEIREQIHHYIDVGITHWIMAVGDPFDLEGLRLFAERVMPSFK